MCKNLDADGKRKDEEIANLKKEVLRREKLADERVKMANAGTAALHAEKLRLENIVNELNNKIRDLERDIETQ